MSAEPLSSIPSPVMPAVDARQNLRWLFVLRNLMIVGEAIVILISIYGLNLPLKEVPLWGILTFLSFFNWWTWLRLTASDAIYENEIFVQLSCDVLAITAILYFTGGATNPIAWFFLLPLIIAATLLRQEYTWYMVIFTSGCYTLLMSYYQPLPNIQPTLQGDAAHRLQHMMPERDLNLHVFGMWFGFVFSAVLVAYFVVEMAKTIRAREQSLAEAREQSLRNERVVALGTLAAGAAHEISTPLATMAILIGEIHDESDSGSNPEMVEKMKILREQVGRCKQALSVMSATAGEIRAESGHVESIDLYMENVVKSWRSQRPGCRLKYHKSGFMPIPFILAELTLTHALVNILNNAADVSPKGIELTVKWTPASIILNVLDRGPGISPSVADRIGKVPISTKEAGLGVGLFLAFATINRLGGSIEMVQRQQVTGTVTKIVLPVVNSGSI